jgi:tetratricopeptide (TPR) repeat protein
MQRGLARHACKHCFKSLKHMSVEVSSCKGLIESMIPGFSACLGGDELSRGMTLITNNKKPLMHDFDTNDITPSIARLSKGHERSHAAVDPVTELQKNIEMVKSAPSSYDGHYACAALYQDLAARSPSSEEQAGHLRSSCSEYEQAHLLKPKAFSPLYNWAVALSELHRVAKDGAGALEQSAEKYREAIRCEPDNPRLLPQALNNLGLVLNELSQSSSSSTRDEKLKEALMMFRASIRILPSFDRSTYNLGTILHSWAGALSAQLTDQYRGIAGTQETSGQELRASREERVRVAYAEAAGLVLFALALQPKKELYRSSFNLVRSALPLPFIRASFLLICSSLDSATGGLMPVEVWEQHWVVLDAKSVRSAMANTLSPRDKGGRSFSLDLKDIISCVACGRDLTLPLPSAFRVGMRNGGGTYLVAENEESRDGWMDALTLASYIVQSRGEQALSSLLV